MFHISTGEDSKHPFLSFCKVKIDKVVKVTLLQQKFLRRTTSTSEPHIMTHDMTRDQGRIKCMEPTFDY